MHWHAKNKTNNQTNKQTPFGWQNLSGSVLINHVYQALLDWYLSQPTDDPALSTLHHLNQIHSYKRRKERNKTLYINVFTMRGRSDMENEVKGHTIKMVDANYSK